MKSEAPQRIELQKMGWLTGYMEERSLRRVRFFVTLVLLSGLWAVRGWSGTQTWTGNAFPNRSWFAPANWSNPAEAPPKPADKVEIPNESSVFIGQDVSIASIQVGERAVLNGAGASLTLSEGAKLRGILTNLDLIVGEMAVLDWQPPSIARGANILNRGLIEAKGCRLFADALTNLGTMLLAEGSCLEIPVIRNEGILRKETGRGVVQLSGQTLLNLGQLEVASGSMLLDRLNVNSEGVIHLGNGEASLQLYSGTLVLGSNSLTVLGVGGGVLPFGGNDEIRANSAVTLAGRLRINLLPSHQASPGRRFPILGFASRQGNFREILGLDACDGDSVATEFTPVGLTLVNTNAVQGEFPEIFVRSVAAGWEFCWPPGFTGFELQSSSDLLDWVGVSPSKNPWPVTATALGGLYFRLWKP